MVDNLCVQIVTWNSMDVLPAFLESLQNQTIEGFQIMIIDNGSNDGVEKYVRENAPEARFIRNARNLGFAAAHNQGFHYMLDRLDPRGHSSSFFLVLNPDMILESDFLEKLIKAAENHPDYAAFGPKLLRIFKSNYESEIEDPIKSDVIDSTGIRAKANRTFHDRGAGEIDQGQFDEDTEVFGVSGAALFIRASALVDVMIENDFFDQDFFMYKEDVDLAWRLQNKGWKALYVPEAVAYHFRGMYGKEKMSLWERFKNRRGKSQTRSYYSNRNQWLLLAKNENFGNFLLASPRVVPMEAARFVYTLFFETKNVKAFGEALVLMPKMFKKRKINRPKINNADQRRIFTTYG